MPYLRSRARPTGLLPRSGSAAAVLERLRFNWLHTSGPGQLWDSKGHRWK